MEDLEIKELRDQRRYFSELYLEEVIKPFLPNAYISSLYSFGPPKGLFKSAKISLGKSSKAFQKSRYYYNRRLKFIHYTSFPNLINILNDKAIRMFDFNFLNDPQEYIFSSNKLKVTSIYPDQSDIKASYSHYQCVSMMKSINLIHLICGGYMVIQVEV